MSNEEQSIFFSLIKISIWNRAHDRKELELLLQIKVYSWSAILEAFEEHALLGVVADAVLSLPESLQPSESQKEHILLYVANLYQTRFKTHHAIVTVYEQLETAGCNPILLKGEGLAQLYPSQCIRACGDVDVYVGTKDFEKAVNCMKSICEPKDIEHAKIGGHDYYIIYKDIPFEIHFSPGYASVETAEQKYQELANCWLTPYKCQTITILGKQILIPAAQYNILYVFEHLARHYRNAELGIRQFLDWALLLENTPFDEGQLKKNLEELKTLNAWIRLAGVLSSCFENENIPFLDKKRRSNTSKILQVVIRRGNFAQLSTESEAKGGLYYICSLFKRSREIALVFPQYSIKWLYTQLKQSFAGYFHKRPLLSS